MVKQPQGSLIHCKLLFSIASVGCWGFEVEFRHTTFGRTPLDEWFARLRDLYLTTHNTHNRRTSIPPAGFEPSIPPSEQPQTHAIERAATGISWLQITRLGILCPAFWSIAFTVYYRMLIHQSDNTFVHIPNIFRITMSGFGASVNGSGHRGDAARWPVCSVVELPGWCGNQRHKKYKVYACRLRNWMHNHSSARPTGHVPGWRNSRSLLCNSLRVAATRQAWVRRVNTCFRLWSSRFFVSDW